MMLPCRDYALSFMPPLLRAMIARRYFFFDAYSRHACRHVAVAAAYAPVATLAMICRIRCDAATPRLFRRLRCAADALSRRLMFTL